MKGLAKFCETKFGRIVLVCVLLCLITIICISLFTNRTVDVWGLRIGPKEKDTVYVTIRDTVKQFVTIPATEQTKFTQKNRSGKNEINNNSGTNNGIQGGEGNIQAKNVNTAPNFGNLQVGDKIVGKVLTPQEEIEAVNFLKYMFTTTGIKTNTVLVIVMNYSNAPNVGTQIVELYNKNGYTALGPGTVMGDGIPVKNIKFSVADDSSKIVVKVGLFDQQ